MSSKKIFAFVIIIVYLCQGVSLAQQSNNENTEAEIYLRLKPEIARQKITGNSENVNIKREIDSSERIIENKGKKITKAKRPFYYSKNEKLKNVYRLKISDTTNIQQLIKDLRSNPEVELAEQVFVRKIIAVPNDTLYQKQWHLKKIQASEAWDVLPGQSIIKVAVVDNGIQTNHEDLTANMLPGFDVSDNDNNPNPPNNNFSHGTHVAGIVAMVNNNTTGGASASNNKVKVIPVKATSNFSNANFIDNGFEGIVWATNNGADIISLSWGGGNFSQIEQDIINDAYNNGILVIAAAGNENSAEPLYPAAYEHVLAVASLDSTDVRSSFSSFGSFVDISAPGRGIISTVPTNQYASFNGTSMATPLVASSAAYILSCFPTLSPDSLEIILKKTADNIDSQNPSFIGQLGAGRINLLKAISCKNDQVFDQQIAVSPSNFFCEGDSVLASIDTLQNAVYNWYLNGNLVSSSPTYQLTTEGQLKLKVQKGVCSVTLDPVNMVFNKTLSPVPSTNDLLTYYCSDNNFLVGVGSSCDGTGPSEFSYSGPMVGFDGNEQLGEYPSVMVSGMAGLVDTLQISVTWQKKDGGYETDCDVADGGFSPFNDEVSFALLSPEGIYINLLNTSTFNSGASTAGVVTTVFSVHGNAFGTAPQSGLFKPVGDLTKLHGKIAQGKWTLIANDNYTVDPLCVSGFSIKIKTDASPGNAVLSWYDQQMNLLTVNDTLEFAANTLGETRYMLKSQCNGMCPSTAAVANVYVKTVPTLKAFARSAVSLTNSQILEVVNAQTVDYTISSTGLYTINGLNESGNAFSYLLSNLPPYESEVTLCEEDDFVVFGLHCNGQIKWSTGDTAMAVVVENLNSSMELKATCLQNWNCPPISDVPFKFKSASEPVTITGKTDPFLNQSYHGENLSSVQQISESNRIQYSSNQNITLLPGFETKTGVLFKAELKSCP